MHMSFNTVFTKSQAPLPCPLTQIFLTSTCKKKCLEKNLFCSLQSKYRTENEVLTREAKLVAPKMLSVIIRTFMKQNLLKTVSNEEIQDLTF